MTVTKPQANALRIVRTEGDAGRAFNHDRFRVNARVLERLRALGLIISESPFAYRFHTVRITDAGRKALDEAS
jgi:hypothetical protein